MYGNGLPKEVVGLRLQINENTQNLKENRKIKAHTIQATYQTQDA
jgi:hypothetical protein